MGGLRHLLLGRCEGLGGCGLSEQRTDLQHGVSGPQTGLDVVCMSLRNKGCFSKFYIPQIMKKKVP